MAAYHPKAGADVLREAEKLSMQGTREYLLLLRDGACRICPFTDVLTEDSSANLFWRETAKGHLYCPGAAPACYPRRARLPEGSVVTLDYGDVLRSMEQTAMPSEQERKAAASEMARHSLTRCRLCSTLDFIQWLKGDV